MIKSAVFHYEFEFIYPFQDGNGRMGRMWHSLLLGRWKELFFWLPIEELIQSRQDEYYDALGLSHRPTFRKNYLAPALERGLIERTVPDKPKSRNQKYRKVK